MFSECCRGHEGSLAWSPSQCADLDAHPGSNLRESWSPCCTNQCFWRKTMQFHWLSSQWFQQFLVLMQKKYYLYLFLIWHFFRTVQMLTGFFLYFLFSKSLVFIARFALKRRVFCSLGQEFTLAKCNCGSPASVFSLYFWLSFVFK